MLSINILNSKEKKQILAKLEKTYGIRKINGNLLKTGKNKIRILTADINSEKLKQIQQTLNIELLGLYFIKEEPDGLRLSFDASNIFKKQITKNIFNATDEQTNVWLSGGDILLNKEQEQKYKGERGFFVIENKSEIVGCGKLSLSGNQARITNFVPKERRVKK